MRPTLYNEKEKYSCVCLDGNYFCIWTVPLVLLICIRYSFDVEGDSDGDPVEVILHDRILSMMCLGYLVLMCTVLYL